jgi:hypothetical protein
MFFEVSLYLAGFHPNVATCNSIQRLPGVCSNGFRRRRLSSPGWPVEQDDETPAFPLNQIDLGGRNALARGALLLLVVKGRRMIIDE